MGWWTISRFEPQKIIMFIATASIFRTSCIMKLLTPATHWLLTVSNSARNNSCGRKGSHTGIHYVVTLTVVGREQTVVWIASPGKDYHRHYASSNQLCKISWWGDGENLRLWLASTRNAFHAWASAQEKPLLWSWSVWRTKPRGKLWVAVDGEVSEGEGTREVGETVELKTY